MGLTHAGLNKTRGMAGKPGAGLPSLLNRPHLLQPQKAAFVMQTAFMVGG